MSSSRKAVPAVAVVLLAALSIFPCRAGEREPELVSEFDMIFTAVGAVDGIRLVRADDVPGNVYTEDCGPSQVLEIIRPRPMPIRVGRLTTSCQCLQATMAKREYGPNERALIEVRNVRPTVPAGATYLVFAQLTEPYQAALQFELYAKSDRNLDKGKAPSPRPAAPAEQPAPSGPKPRGGGPFRAPGYGLN